MFLGTQIKLMQDRRKKSIMKNGSYSCNLNFASLRRSTNNLFTLMTFMSAWFLTFRINNTSPEELNHYPNYLFLYCYHLVFPNIIGAVVLGFYFLQNEKLRHVIFNGFKNTLFFETFISRSNDLIIQLNV
jgi:hypothetical protein